MVFATSLAVGTFCTPGQQKGYHCDAVLGSSSMTTRQKEIVLARNRRYSSGGGMGIQRRWSRLRVQRKDIRRQCGTGRIWGRCGGVVGCSGIGVEFLCTGRSSRKMRRQRRKGGESGGR
ncbi:hypothetical protein BJX68DRAFT_250969 [Aspergillus pseudodeflectus]|uniref:Secreted protein n=1 Tax=Aspergillus pseudodeflectus TaxID=176178 RepID=A0ABR4J7Z8_9EURO